MMTRFLGMVGSINAPTTGTNTFANFMAAAKAIGSSGEPIVSAFDIHHVVDLR